jgi:glycosyltransferase involved in cell wall biosynthesis
MNSTPRLRVLYVAYPLLPVSDESAGGAEQMLWTLAHEMARRGHEPVVAACDGSQVSGELLPTGRAATGLDQLEQREAEHTSRILGFLDECRQFGDSCDLVHDKSGHFWKHASAIALPVLATLHLPRHFYRAELFDSAPANLSFNCVSSAQAQTFAGLKHLVQVVQNGIEVERFPATEIKGDYVLWLGRICEEKGAHVAIDVASRAGVPLVIAGQVYPFSYHQQYFSREILPRLAAAHGRIKFVQAPSVQEKLSLLQRARALLVPALVDETSSLVAMEAMACGTPVIAFRRGALPEVIVDGKTGLVVDTPEEMVAAIPQSGAAITARECRRRAELCYTANRMASDYEVLYRRILTACESETENVRAA